MLLKFIPLAIITSILGISGSDAPSFKTNSTLYLDLSSGQYTLGMLDNYSKLITLNLSDNSIKYLPSSVAGMTELKNLYLSRNQDLDISSVLNTVHPKLNLLDISGCQLTRFPLGINRLSQIREINLSGNYISVLPYDFNQLSKLEAIDLSDNQLVRLDYCPNFWWNLKRLDVRNNPDLQHSSLFRALTYLDNLQELNVSHLKRVPEEFIDMPIRSLTIENSPDLYFAGYLEQNSSIHNLTLVGEIRHLGSILSEADKAMQLRSLGIHGALKEVPPQLVDSKKLRYLDLRNNSIASIDKLKLLTHLKGIKLSGNPLTPDQIVELQANLPGVSVEFESVDVQAPVAQKISPPIEAYKGESETVRISGSESSVVKLEAVEFKIPGNAFLNADGSVYSGTVDLVYKPYMDPVSVFLSGIPMKYDSSGLQYNFSSAGMFDLRAYAEDGSELKADPENPIVADLPSRDDASNYSLYNFNEASNTWIPIDAAQSVNSLGSGLNTNFPFSVPASNALSNRIASARQRTERVVPKVKCHSRTNSFTIDIKRYTHKGVKNLKYLNDADIFDKYTIVYAGDSLNRDFQYLSQISHDIEKVYRKIHRKSNRYITNGPVFIGNISIAENADPDVMTLVIEYKDTVLKYPVYPYFEDARTDLMIRKYGLFGRRHRQIAERARHSNLSTERRLKRLYARIDRELAASGIDLRVADFEKNRQEWQEGFRTQVKAKRQIPVTMFGIINCDRIQSMGAPARVLAKFVESDGSVPDLKSVHLLNFDQNTVLGFSTLESVLVDESAAYNLVFITADNRMCILRSGKMWQYKYRDKNEVIPLNFESIAGLSNEEIVLQMSL